MGDRDSLALHRGALPLDHESVAVAGGERDIRSLDPRQDDRIRQHHRHSVSREEYLVVEALSPQDIRERPLSSGSPPRRTYASRTRDFPPQEAPEQRESDYPVDRDFRPRDGGRFAPKVPREQRDHYSRGPHPQDPPPHGYDSSLARTHHMPVHDVDATSSARTYPPAEPPQRRESSPSLRENYHRRYARDDQYYDRTSRTWERGAEVPTPPSAEGRHGSRKHHSDGRRGHREAMSDTEYIDSRSSGRSRRREEGRSGGYDDIEGEPRYKRQEARDEKQAYGREDRQWTPRDAPIPQPQVRSPPSRMDVDVNEESLGAPEPLPGWVGFSRHNRSRETRESVHQSYRSRAGARETWPPAPDVEGDAMAIENGVEGGKRQRVEGGTKMIGTFNREDEDLRKWE